MMAPETTPTAAAADTEQLRSAFRELCVDYEDIVDEAVEVTPPVDERLGLALFKIDEATAVADMLRQDAAESHEMLMEALVANCRELEDIFIRINLIEGFVAKAQVTTRELEARMDSIAKVSDPVFNTSSVTTLLRSFSIKRPAAESTPVLVQWEPMDLSLNASQLIERLDSSSAQELGVSIANRVGGPSEGS